MLEQFDLNNELLNGHILVDGWYYNAQRNKNFWKGCNFPFTEIKDGIAKPSHVIMIRVQEVNYWGNIWDSPYHTLKDKDSVTCLSKDSKAYNINKIRKLDY